MLLRWLAAVLLVLVGAAAGLALHTATTKGDTVFSWKRPANLGVREGRLAACKTTPNCVSSQADPADREHHIAPIPFRGSAAEAMAAVRKAVEAMERTTVIAHERAYLYAEFRSRLMGYVDDVEFAHDAAAGLIHVRSASRLGRRDFGVNRARVEQLRSLIEGRVKT